MKIVTWNMQGGSQGTDANKTNVLTKFFNEEYDIICLQEATDSLNTFDEETAPDSGIFRRSMTGYSTDRLRVPPTNNYWCCKYIFGSSNTRCSLVTYFRSALFNSKGLVVSTIGGRSMLWVRVLHAGSILVTIGNVHLISGYPNGAFTQFRHFRSVLAALGGLYIITGDFNMTPDDIAARIPGEGLNMAHFHHDGVATHRSGNILDYVYFTGAVNNMSVDDYNYSDHHCFSFNIF